MRRSGREDRLGSTRDGSCDLARDETRRARLDLDDLDGVFAEELFDVILLGVVVMEPLGSVGLGVGVCCDGSVGLGAAIFETDGDLVGDACHLDSQFSDLSVRVRGLGGGEG